MNLIGTYQATKNADFVARVQAAIVLSAQDILNSDIGPDSPEAKRWNAANEVMRAPESHMWINQFVWRVAANPAIAGTVSTDGRISASDDDILYVVSGAWSALFPAEVTQ